MLNEKMKECLRLAMVNTQFDFGEVVEEGLRLYTESTGGPVEVENEEEAHEFIEECMKYVLDETLSQMILDGLVEVKGIDEHGDMMYGLVGVNSKEDAQRIKEELDKESLDRWEDNGGPVHD